MANEIKLGVILEGEHHRDAIHIAVAPMVADAKLYPGQDIGIVSGNRAGVVKKPIGIVDPFLKGPVQSEQQFYMFLYPQTITSLRHEWTHPAFANEATEVESTLEAAKRTIETFGHAVGLSYDGVLEQAKQYIEDGDYIHRGEDESYKDADWEAMWEAYEIVTGTKVPSDNRGWFFSCSC